MLMVPSAAGADENDSADSEFVHAYRSLTDDSQKSQALLDGKSALSHSHDCWDLEFRINVLGEFQRYLLLLPEWLGKEHHIIRSGLTVKSLTWSPLTRPKFLWDVNIVAFGENFDVSTFLALVVVIPIIV
jgi:hypothetical protein